MTAPFTAEQQARLDTIEAATYAEESLRERVARAIAAADYDSVGCSWADLEDYEHDSYRGLADAALAVIRTPADGAL